MYSEELNKLIEASLVDGVITEKERAVIHKRAQLEGVAPDEVDMILDAELHKLSQDINPSKQGVIKKCPHCGAIIDSFVVTCPYCGYEVNEKKANITIKQLFDKLEEENRLYSENLTKVGKEKAKVKVKFGESTIDVESQLKRAYVDNCCSIIKNFPVPNDSEALLEFLALGTSQIQQKKPLKPYLKASAISIVASLVVWLLARDDGTSGLMVFFISNGFIWLLYLPKVGIEMELSDAWKMKCRQVLTKARLAFKGNHEKMTILDGLEEKMR